MKIYIRPTGSGGANKKGALAVLTALGVVAFLGFVAMVIDMGLVYQTKSLLETAVIAGADLGRKIIDDQNKTTSPTRSGDYRVLAPIRDLMGKYDPSFIGPKTQIIVSTDNVTIEGRAKVDFIFAAVLGMESTEVVATADARGLLTGSKVKNLPLVIPHGDVLQTVQGGVGDVNVTPFSGGQGFVPGKMYLIKIGQEPIGNGERVIFDQAIFAAGGTEDPRANVMIQGQDNKVHGSMHSNVDAEVGGGGHQVDGELSTTQGVKYDGVQETDVLGTDNTSEIVGRQRMPKPPYDFNAPSSAVDKPANRQDKGLSELGITSGGTYHFRGDLQIGNKKDRGGVVIDEGTFKNVTIYTDGDVHMTGHNLKFENLIIVSKGDIQYSGSGLNITRTTAHEDQYGAITFQSQEGIQFSGSSKDSQIDGGFYASGMDAYGNPAPTGANSINFAGNGHKIDGPVYGNDVKLSGNQIEINNPGTITDKDTLGRYFYGPSDPNVTDTVSGPAQYQQLFQYGYEGNVLPGASINPEGGALTDQTKTAMNFYADNPTTSTQIVIPIVEYDTAAKNANLDINLYDANYQDGFKVLGTALFDLKQPDASGDKSDGLNGSTSIDGQVQAEFVRYIIPPPGYSN